jgi:hypothetical protein
VSDTLQITRTTAKVTLSYPFVLEQSESVFVEGRLLAKEDYAIDYQKGIVRFKRPLEAGSTLVVDYTRLPFLLNSVYSLRGFDFAPVTESSPRRERRAQSERPASKGSRPGNLVFGGMKSISFSVGSNRGASLDQSLKATVNGKITPTINVKALLSDENLPIQPEGNTEELEYLDKVYVEVAGKRNKASLGDFTLGNDFSTFSPIKREVKGFAGEVGVGGTKLLLAGASSKGLFRTMTFRGTAGLQGPYELLSQARVTNEVILAGSEKVYMDGELLRRGQNLDYVIDYDRGTITFTPRRLITEDSEIAVDYEVTREKYNRSTLLTGVERENIPGGIALQALYVRESDDEDRPKSISLDDAERRIIARAGDDEGLALGSGVTQVAPGTGEYVLVPEDTIGGVPVHYLFDDSMGTYNLSFIEVGMGRGDYILDGVSKRGTPVYAFAGPGKGNYVVGKELPLPERHELFTVRLTRKRNNGLNLDLEYDLSNYDRNTLSELDDGDNLGNAAALRILYDGVRLLGGDLGLGTDLSLLDERFKSMDRARPWYFYRDWNLEKVPIKGTELLGEIRGTYRRKDSFKADYRVGRISRESFTGIKHEGNLVLKRAVDRNLKSRVFFTSVSGGGEKRTRSHENVTANMGLWKILPSIVWENEEYLKDAASDSGIAYRFYRAGLGSRKGGALGWKISFEDRDTRELADTTGGWVESRRNRTYAVSVASRSAADVRGELEYVHRVDDEFLVGGRRKTDLARLKAMLRSRRLGLRTDVDYEISQNQARTMEKNVVFVGEGKGDYNVLGEPVGKGRGAYMVVFLPTVELVPTHKVDFTWRLKVGKGRSGHRSRGRGLLGWLGANVSLDQTVSVKEETTFDEAWKIYLMVPSALQRDGSTLSGVTSIRQDWSLLDSYRNASLLFRYLRTDEEDNLFKGSAEDRFLAEYDLKFDRSLSSKFTASLELKSSFRRRGGKGLPQGTGSSYDVEERSIEAGSSTRFSAGSTFDFFVQYASRRDAISSYRERLFMVKPSFSYRLRTLATIYGRYEMTRTLEDAGQGARPLFFTGPGDAHRWSLTANVRVSKSISLVTTYDGRSELSFLGKRIIEHNLKVETRAYF